MAETVNVKNMGLRGVTVADTKVSFIDGEKGILIYRGYRIEDLAGKSSFMEVAYLLLNGLLPNQEDLATFQSRITQARQLPDHVFDSCRRWPKEAKPMDVLQASVPLLAMTDPDLAEETRESHVRQAIRLIARLPGLVAGWHRIRQGLEPLPPDDRLSHSADFLRQLHGTVPDEETARDLDTCLTLHADHTFNASTFACREVVSTRAHMYAGVAAGIGALSGSLHGGANAQVMRMLSELESEQNIPAWVEGRLARGERIMGMGHAVYKTMDPRARFLKAMGSRLAQRTGQEAWYRLSTRIEQASLEAFRKRNKTKIQPNVDFYSAPVYHMMGIPGDLMTPIFAMARVSGWCAHIIEEKFADAQGKPALYRPKAEYVGQYCGLMGCTYEPMDKRGYGSGRGER
jgi:citrate synthase